MKKLILGALIALALPAAAMTEYELTCESCHYHAVLPDGPTKVQARKKMRYPKIFFCPDKKTFISVLDAKRTKKSVEAGTKIKIYRSRSCRKGMTPLEFYQRPEKPAQCPVCGSGELKIKALEFID